AATSFQEAKALIESNNCDQMQAGLEKLRAAFFLDPNNNDLRNYLANIYQTNGYPSLAKFYQDPARTIQDENVKKIKDQRDWLLAIQNGDMDKIKAYIRNGGDVNIIAGDPRSGNALSIATTYLKDDKAKLQEFIGLLVENNFRFDPKAQLAGCSEDPQLRVGGCQLIELAIDTNDAQLFEIAFKAGYTTPSYYPSYSHPLNRAVYSGNTELVKKILEKNQWNINELPNGNMHPVELAITSGKRELVECFYTHGFE